ncbi:hypothetical protein [uncultured Sphaerotilus sp.]|uniref:hypothetical protein n=1 Tax=uncultured Sphaerotilus sp. TaxID=474984 RepID=UPI0030CA272A
MKLTRPDNLTPQIIQTWTVRAAGTAGTVVALAAGSGLVWSAVSTGIGLGALALLAGVGFAAIQAVPLGVQMLENRVLGLHKREARRNPIEQLQTDCLRREERLQGFRQALVGIGAQIRSLQQMIDARRRVDATQNLATQEHAVQRMQAFYEANCTRLEEAHAALSAFREQVQQKVFEWEFAQAGQVVMAALHPSATEDLLQGLLTDEALRAVQTRFNTVFAELDVEMRSVRAPATSRSRERPLPPLEVLISAGTPSSTRSWS